MPGRRFYWAELKSHEFRTLDPGKTIVILPVAAIEQHIALLRDMTAFPLNRLYHAHAD